MKKQYIAAMALIAGSLIYVLWRSETLIMFSWFEQMGLARIVNSIRTHTRTISIYLPHWVLFSLPNALWIFSGILVFESIWGAKQSASKLFWISVFLVIAIGAEIGQGFKVIHGTFDWQDMTLTIIAILFAVSIIGYFKQKERGKEI